MHCQPMAKGHTPFQSGHNVLYGLSMTECDKRTSKVWAVSCQFCLKLFCEAKVGNKRKKMTNVQVFKVPFRTDVYTRHHLSAHPNKYKEFQKTLQEGRVTLFDAAVNHASTLMAHFESEGTLNISFNRDVVKILVGSMIFDPYDEYTQGTYKRSLAVLKHCHNASLNDNKSPGEQDINCEAYYITITSV